MTTSDRPPERGEEHVRDLFARAGSGTGAGTGSGSGRGSDIGSGTGSEELLGRIFTAALRRRRRNSILTVAGAAASSVAVVAALVVGPTLLRADREAAGPASSASSTVTLATGTSTDAATTVTPTNATATVSGPVITAPVAPTLAHTGVPSGPAGTTPTVPSSRTGGGADPYAGLLKLFPAPTSIDPGMSWSLEPGLAPAGAAPVMGLQICDQIVVTEALGKAGFAAAEKQVTAAMASTTTGKDWPGVDIVLAVWPPGHGEAAWAQLNADTGMCIWHGSPTVTAWSGHTGLLVTSPEVMMAKWHTAAAVQLVGDVTIGVTAVDTDRAAALRRAQTLCDALASDVRASGLGQG